MPSSGKVFTPKQGNPQGYNALLYEKPEGGFWNFALPDSFLCNCTARGVGRKSRNCQGGISPCTCSELWVWYLNTTDKAGGTQTPESTLSCVPLELEKFGFDVPENDVLSVTCGTSPFTLRLLKGDYTTQSHGRWLTGLDWSPVLRNTHWGLPMH